MSIKTKVLTALFFVLTFTINSQTIPKDSTIIVVFDFRDNEFDENLLTKVENDAEILFTKGIDACGLLDYFKFNIKKGKRKQLSLDEMKKLNATNIKVFNMEHLAKNEGIWNEPGKFFKKISLIEIDEKGVITLYEPMEWDRPVLWI